MLLYWLENVVVGAFNVAKLLLARPQETLSNLSKLLFVPFFIVHFGIFTFVHGVFVFALFGPKDPPAFDLAHAVPPAIQTYHLGWGVTALVLSHGLSFFWNYLAKGEFRRASLNALMTQPYGRVLVLHVTVLGGAWIASALGAPTPALLLLVALKTAADVRAHRTERERFASLPAASLGPIVPSPSPPTENR